MESISKHRKGGKLHRQGVKRRSHPKAKDQVRTPANGGRAFLTCQFLPLAKALPQELSPKRKVEREFFNSLSNLARLYQFQPTDVRQKVYPDNIRCAFADAQRQLKTRQPDVELFIAQDNGETVSLHTAKPLNTGSTLYYIPVRPLWSLLQDRKQKRVAEMLLSVYAYLYQVAGVPYFREDMSYLCGTYEMLADWILDGYSEDEEEYAEQANTIKTLTHWGDRLLRQIKHPYHLQAFGKRVRQFDPANEAELSAHQVCFGFMELYQAYPHRSFFDNIHVDFLEPQEEERIFPEQYLSFYWDYNDNLHHSLFETVNLDLQEKAFTEEPIALQAFDKPQTEVSPHSMEFESRLLDLIGDLTSLL